MKVKIFVDFWNLQLAWNEYHRGIGATAPVRIPWRDKLPKTLLEKVGNDSEYAGTHVYASINPKSEADRKLNSFLQIMNTFEGYTVIVKKRKPAKTIKCPNDGCRRKIETCPHCSKELIRTVEKGVDTSIAIELFHYALDNVYDKAILLSDDADFVPAVEYIQRRGNQIIHAGFKNKAFEIKKACWSHVDFEDIMPDLLNSGTG
ncbi:MAG: NYN domain-containing protein [Thermodesulfovibrionales bacterium]|nr:NYN domain-containing protein [Thermodesulfovibrionales bacterium]